MNFQRSLLMQKKTFRILFSIVLVAIFYIAIDFLLEKWGVYLRVGQVQRTIVNAVSACLLLLATQKTFA